MKLRLDWNVLYKMFTYLLAKSFFLSKFEFVLQDISNPNPYLPLLLCDYNARNTNLWCHDITTTIGAPLETTTTIYGIQQLIDGPTHILLALTSFSQISQNLLSTWEYILLFITIVNTKLPLVRPDLELTTFHLINVMSGILQKLA